MKRIFRAYYSAHERSFVLHCTRCDTREAVKLEKVHDAAVIHNHWWHRDSRWLARTLNAVEANRTKRRRIDSGF